MNNTTPLVSIITPTYNHQAFIQFCVDSALAQTYQNWEQIILDDGSTDSTAKIVSTYCDPRIRYIHQNNQGAFELANSYNRALSAARGDLVAILEGDDYWPTNKLASLVPAFDDSDVVLAYGEAADVDIGGQIQRGISWTTRLRKALSSSVRENKPIGAATRYMLWAEGRSLVSPSTVIIRRSALEKIGGFQHVSGLPLTDYPTFIELSLMGNFHYLGQIMGYRRRHQKSITVNHERTIYEKVSAFTLDFLNIHSDEMPLTQEELCAIQENWEQSRHKLDFSEGRFLLLKKRWREARHCFYIASKSKDTKVRIAALVGLLLSRLHLNIEPLMKLAGRAQLKTSPV